MELRTAVVDVMRKYSTDEELDINATKEEPESVKLLLSDLEQISAEKARWCDMYRVVGGWHNPSQGKSYISYLTGLRKRYYTRRATDTDCKVVEEAVKMISHDYVDMQLSMHCINVKVTIRKSLICYSHADIRAVAEKPPGEGMDLGGTTVLQST